MRLRYSDSGLLPRDQVIHLYRSNKWSSAEKPDELMHALAHSDCVVAAWDDDHLVGLGNAISDGALVVYYPHLLVLPEYQRKGIGGGIMERMLSRYRHLHQQILVAETADAAAFYRSIGMREMSDATAMDIYQGQDH